MTAFLKPDPELLAWIEKRHETGEAEPAIYTPGAPFELRFECPWCGHDEHGFACRNNPAACRCENSYRRLDDTWRTPRQYSDAWALATVMDELGCDGWVARFLKRKGPFLQPPTRRADIEKALYGRTS